MKIVLIHGLARTSLSLLSLERRLRRSGWATEQFAYTAFLEPYDRIVTRLKTRLAAIAHQAPYGIVAHSLGGILTRAALGSVTFRLPVHTVMLGPPNRPPRLARYAWQAPPFRWFTGDCGGNLAKPEFFAQLPSLQSPYTIIAGTAGPRGVWSPFGPEVNDGIVALSETVLADDDRPITLPVFHTFMMNDRTLQDTVVQILSTAHQPQPA